MSFHENRRAYLAISIASLGGMTLGYDTGVAGGVVVLPSFLKSFFGTATPSAAAKASLSSNVVSVLFAGCFFASLGSAFVVHYIGRKRGLQMGSLIFILGGILQIVSTSNVAFIYAGRVIAGLGVGFMSAMAPAFTNEIAPAQFRNACTSMFQFWLVIGGMIAYFAAYGSSIHQKGVLQWRIPLALQCIPGGLLFVGMFFCKESPRWLAAKGKNEEALATLAYYRGKTEYDESVLMEFAEIEAQLQEELSATSGVTLKELFKKGNAKRFNAALGIVFFQIFTGHNSILYYGPTIFGTIGFSGSASLYASGIFGAIKVVCTPLFIFFISERFGRKTILHTANVSRVVVMAIFAGLLSHKVVAHSASANAAAAMLYLFIAVYAFSYGPIPWTYAAEIWPQRYRSMGISIAIAFQWLMNYVISTVTPIALNRIGYKWWIIIAMFNALASFHLFTCPETKGLSMEAIDILFGDQDEAARREHIRQAANGLGGHDLKDIVEDKEEGTVSVLPVGQV